MKKNSIYLVKLCVAGILAFAILNVLSLCYYNPPVAIKQENKTTNYKMVPNKSWADLSEGAGYGTTDNLGYNNAYDRNCTNPNVVVMGSSHMEARQVHETANAVYLLNQAFDTDVITGNELKCLNIGVSGHDFKILVSNLNYVLEEYDEVEYVVMETSNLMFSEMEFDNMLNDAYHSDLQDRGMLYTMFQKSPYLRLMYLQMSHVINNKNAGVSQSIVENKAENDWYESRIEQLMSKLSNSAQINDAKIIVMYHHTFDIEGSVSKRTDQDRYYDLFKQSCEKYNIEFVDVTDSFMKHYDETYEMPYGFVSTTYGAGHLNEVGHKVISDELYKKINSLLEVE